MSEKEYIERGSLLEWVREFYPEEKVFASAVINAPAADVQEVVRCKDCSYFCKATVNKKGFLICPASGIDITDNDFCSYGTKNG